MGFLFLTIYISGRGRIWTQVLLYERTGQCHEDTRLLALEKEELELSKNCCIGFLAVEILISLNSNRYLKFCRTRILFLKLWSLISQVESSGEGWLSPANTCKDAKKQVSDCSWVTVKHFCCRKS